ncbi:hypothetical protein OPV22_016824 [Ensete ventricosum]|uniref:Uncharacterized protein n=1 Tax=Ensete ventricosum TaxID=4639 RepID=A0AAV8R0V3_ENSVE|nr:hypothetical protein OPV22_016823 [Ensete ventricosum]KAJ8484339.1 hypothetical protein OPV22_016824 [Ensete ventricosum]
MEDGDDWLAADKLDHLLACFCIAILVAALAGRSRHAFLRRRSVALGSIAALVAGAGKEAGDEIGLWRSAGASSKDAAADVLGVLPAAVFLSVPRRFWRSSPGGF